MSSTGAASVVLLVYTYVLHVTHKRMYYIQHEWTRTTVPFKRALPALLFIAVANYMLLMYHHRYHCPVKTRTASVGLHSQ
jgi:hypothetical protein